MTAYKTLVSYARNELKNNRHPQTWARNIAGAFYLEDGNQALLPGGPYATHDAASKARTKAIEKALRR